MQACFIRICVVFLLSISSCSAVATIENGGYSVLVAFSQNVPFQPWTEIEKIKTSLEEASEILYSAIGLQFSKVAFEIPDSWDTSEYDNITIEDSFNSDSADILIDNADDTVFGKFPSAQQYGSCGVPGYQLIVPSVFFQDVDNFPKGTALAREWLKYQYGVFDENGYSDDPLYPLYYHVPGSNDNDVFVTNCTNSEFTYNFTDQNGNECPSDKMLIDKLREQECALNINEDNLESITSSLMYFEKHMTNMTHICGKDENHKHNSRSPNKQNILCYEKSIWDVISQSSNYIKEEVKKKSSAVEFVFTRKAKPRIVLAWENTKKLETKGEIILNAIRKLVIDLPSGSKFRAFPFDTDEPDEDTTFELEDVDDVKSRTINLISNFLDNGDGNFKAAIRKGISILRKAAENHENLPGNIIIITGTADNLIIILLKDLCLESWNENSIPTNLTELKSDLPCFEVIRIPMTERTEVMFEKLVEAIERNCLSKLEDKLTEMLKTEYINETSSLLVEVDDYTEKVTFTIFPDIEKESKRFELEFNGIKMDIKKVVTEVRYGKVLELSYSTTVAGIIDLSFPYPTNDMLVEARKTSKPGKYFSGKVTVYDTTGDEDQDQMPVIIYAFIRYGSYPVQNAKVSAIIQRPDGEEIQLDLNDDGKGDPDITLNDGVYSRYFTSFSSEGDYTVTVTVGNNGFATTYGASENSGYNSCCGSKVGVGGIKLTPFEKIFETTFSTKSGRPDDGYKPSRITDLRIEKVTDDGILLKWTAPGEEADSGTASRYAIKLYCGEENATECNIHQAIEVVNKPPPLNYGKEQQLKIKIIDRTQTLSIAIIAFNEKNKTSESNIIEIFRSSATPEITTRKPEIKAAQASKTGIIVGWTIAGLLIIICILGVVIYFRKKHHKQPEIHNVEENRDVNKTKSTFEARDSHIKHASVRKIESFPVLLYTHDQIKDYRSKENDQPLSKSNEPAKQWKSLDGISNLEKENKRDTKSLGSSSTVNLEEDNNKKRNYEQ